MQTEQQFTNEFLLLAAVNTVIQLLPPGLSLLMLSDLSIQMQQRYLNRSLSLRQVQFL